MISTMDKAGRVVIPRAIRDELGLTPGELTISVRGACVQIEQPGSHLREVDGRLLLPAGGVPLTADTVRELRLADQR